jgi:hypothetical protein
MGTLMSMASMSPGPRRATVAPAGGDYYSERAARRSPASRYAAPTWDDDEADDEGETGALDGATPRATPAPMLGRKPGSPGSTTKPLRIYPFGVSRSRLEQAVALLGVPVSLARDTSDADIVLTLKNYYKKKPPALRAAEGEGLPGYVLKSNTASQMQQILASIFELPPTGLAAGGAGAAPAGDGDEDPLTAALVETEEAITHVLESAEAVELPPANAYIRRLQHQMAERYNLGSQSRGREPNRRVRIYRPEA